jgi:hypothetical protein
VRLAARMPAPTAPGPATALRGNAASYSRTTAAGLAGEGSCNSPAGWQRSLEASWTASLSLDSLTIGPQPSVEEYVLLNAMVSEAPTTTASVDPSPIAWSGQLACPFNRALTYRCDLVATTLATVCASVDVGLTWKTGNESFPSTKPRVDRMTETKCVHVLCSRCSDEDRVRSCFLSAVQTAPRNNPVP